MRRSRDLIRCIEDVRGDLMRARHRLSKFLLRRGQRYADAQAWSQKHLRWLHALGFDDACSQAAFADYLAAVELLAGRRSGLLIGLEQQALECADKISKVRELRLERVGTRQPVALAPASRDRRVAHYRRCLLLGRLSTVTGKP